MSINAKQNSLPDGVYAAVLTPMRSDLSCDCGVLARHCLDLIERGCDGVVLFGTTGEGPSFSVAERLEALEKLISLGLNPKKVIFAGGCSGISDTVEIGREAVKRGCAALLIAPPSFYKNVSDSGVIAYYREVIERIADPNLRVLLYHIPQYSGVPISLEVIGALRREFPEIVIGIKESEGNLPFTKEILESFDGFKVFVGKEKHIIEAVDGGAAGTICGIANLYPELMRTLYKQGKKAPCANPASFEAISKALSGLSFISAAKALMENREGGIWHAVRPPLVPLGREQGEKMISALKEYGLEN